MNMLFKRRDLQIACEVLARTQQGLPPESNDYKFKGELEVTLEELENLKECQNVILRPSILILCFPFCKL